MKNLISNINLSAKVTEHIVGTNHTIVHQRIAGTTIMVIGVGFVKIVPIFFHAPLLLEIMIDIVGYGLHAIGLIPFASQIEKH